MAAAALAASLLLTVCRVFTPSPRLLLMATAFVPFALFGYAVAALGWWAVRRGSGTRLRRPATVAAAVSLLGVGLHAGLLVPAYAGSHAAGRPDLTVMTLNLRLGLADTTATTHLAERVHADVVVLEEVTPMALPGLEELQQKLPYLAGSSFVGARGTMVFSRYPLTQVHQLVVFNGAWLMRVDAPRPFSLIALHTSQPMTSPQLWAADHQSLRWVAALAQRSGALVMAGDFNATLDHRPMRSLLGTGLADAARQADSGWQPTWPGDRGAAHGLPFDLGAMAIDHVLVSRQLSAISTTTHVVRGSDHRALVARLAFS